MFALSIYGLVIYPKSLGYINDAVMELFDSPSKGVNLVPTILVETFRSLNACKKAREGRFIGCAQLLLIWFHSYFWKPKRVTYQACFQNHSPLQILASTPRQEDIPHEKWMVIFQNLHEKDIVWKARYGCNWLCLVTSIQTVSIKTIHSHNKEVSYMWIHLWK
ncbi:hypothetical protein GQ457_05G019290 [Hibiscus cannabinus]